jgi:hypothetical protein
MIRRLSLPRQRRPFRADGVLLILPELASHRIGAGSFFVAGARCSPAGVAVSYIDQTSAIDWSKLRLRNATSIPWSRSRARESRPRDQRLTRSLREIPDIATRLPVGCGAPLLLPRSVSGE